MSARCRRSLTAWCSAHYLGDAEQVALAIAEPGSPFATPLARVVALDIHDPVHGAVVLLEHHPAGAQVGDRCLDVVDVETHLRERAVRCAGRGEQTEDTGRALVTQAAVTFLDRFEAKLVGIPAACSGKILSGDTGLDPSVVQHL